MTESDPVDTSTAAPAHSRWSPVLGPYNNPNLEICAPARSRRPPSGGPTPRSAAPAGCPPAAATRPPAPGQPSGPPPPAVQHSSLVSLQNKFGVLLEEEGGWRLGCLEARLCLQRNNPPAVNPLSGVSLYPNLRDERQGICQPRASANVLNECHKRGADGVTQQRMHAFGVRACKLLKARRLRQAACAIPAMAASSGGGVALPGHQVVSAGTSLSVPGAQASNLFRATGLAHKRPSIGNQSAILKSRRLSVTLGCWIPHLR